MKAKFLVWIAVITILSAGMVVSVSAQGKQQKPPAQSGKPGAAGSAAAPVAPAGPTVNKEEETEYKAFYEARGGEPAKQVQLGEDFLKKYPESVYQSAVYTQLTSAYMDAGQEDKMFVAGAKALELNPDNINVLALLSMAMPRRVNSTTNALDAAQQYQKAETYGKRAIELANTLPKPEGIDDASFEKGKNELLSMAHSGLGLINYQRQKYPESITELSLAVQLAANPDPVDYYLLGSADVLTSHFNDAVTAFGKCSATGPLAAQCKKLGEDAKKKASTQLSAPQ